MQLVEHLGPEGMHTLGQGQVVCVVGEPGLGKTRLLAEFYRSLAGQRVKFLEGHCVSYGSLIPHLPLLELLRQQCAITGTQNPDEIRDKVRWCLQELELSGAEWDAYLLHFLGSHEVTNNLSALSSETIKSRTFEVLRQMYLACSKRHPLVIGVEDFHWIDLSSEDFFVPLIESLASTPILLLATYRPGYRPPWVDRSYMTQIALQRLTSAESRALVDSIVHDDVSPRGLEQIILDRTDGNPLFLEELTWALREHADMRADVGVPETIEDVIMARIDRLPQMAKRLLQAASVLGRTFPAQLLRSIWDEPSDLTTPLQELQRQEFLYKAHETEEPA